MISRVRRLPLRSNAANDRSSGPHGGTATKMTSARWSRRVTSSSPTGWGDEPTLGLARGRREIDAEDGVGGVVGIGEKEVGENGCFGRDRVRALEFARRRDRNAGRHVVRVGVARQVQKDVDECASYVDHRVPLGGREFSCMPLQGALLSRPDRFPDALDGKQLPGCGSVQPWRAFFWSWRARSRGRARRPPSRRCRGRRARARVQRRGGAVRGGFSRNIGWTPSSSSPARKYATDPTASGTTSVRRPGCRGRLPARSGCRRS